MGGTTIDRGLNSKSKKRSYKSKRSKKDVKGMSTKKALEFEQDEIRAIKKTLKKTAPERKLIGVYSQDITSIQNVQQFFLLNGLSEGTNLQNRIAERVQFTNMQIAVQFYSTANLDTSVQVRAVVFQDKMAEGVTVGTNDLFYWTGNPSPNMLRNYLNRNQSRFNIYMDEIVTIYPTFDQSGGVTPYNMSGPANIIIKDSFKIPVKTSYARDDTGTITDIDTGAIYLMVVSDLNDDGVNGEFTYNLFFTDC